jgi:hypothetical protein
MRHEPLRVTFHLDGTGTVWYPSEPLHLDGVLAYDALARSGRLIDLAAEDNPTDAELPLARYGSGDSWYWSASVLLPAGPIAESMQMARRRLNTERAELVADKTISREIGQTKSQNRPWLLQLSIEFVGYCFGDLEAIRDLCGDIRWLGAERGRGKGRVTGVTVEPFEHDWSVSRDGLAMRYIPDARGTRWVRPHPPYWHPLGAVPCLSAGDAIE